MTGDRKADHTTKKWLAIGENAYAKAILPNNK